MKKNGAKNFFYFDIYKIEFIKNQFTVQSTVFICEK